MNLNYKGDFMRYFELSIGLSVKYMMKDKEMDIDTSSLFPRRGGVEAVGKVVAIGQVDQNSPFGNRAC